MGAELLFVTQVAPYSDGPAGFHGVLHQASTALAQIAEIQSLSPSRVDDVRAVSDSTLTAARALALFTIGETPWSAPQRALILERLRHGDLVVLAWSLARAS